MISSKENEFRQMPADIKIEKTVLGAILLERNAFPEVRDILTPETFYYKAHQDIFEAVVQLFQKGEPIDSMTVVTQLQKTAHLDGIGGAAYVTKLTNYAASAARIVSHAIRLVDLAIRREIIKTCDRNRDKVYTSVENTSDLLNRLEEEVFAIGSLKKKSDQEVYRAQKGFMAARKGKGKQPVATGFIKLDKLLNGGLTKGQVTIVAARPGVGKTSFMLNLGLFAARSRKKTIFFSLEMSNKDITLRNISAFTGIPLAKLKQPLEMGATDEDEKKMLDTLGPISDIPFFSDDTAAISITEIRTKCRRHKSRHGLDLVIVDYMQLLTVNTKNCSREQEVAKISAGLKGLAKELDVVVLAASQLNRSVEVRGGDYKPKLIDLRERGSIEQYADQVMFVYRPGYYGLDSEDDSNEKIAEIIVAKNRHGSLGTAILRWIPEIQRFENRLNEL